MATLNDLRTAVAQEVDALHAKIDEFHHRFYHASAEVAQEGHSQVEAGNNPFAGLVTPPAPSGHVAADPAEAPADSTSDAGSSGTSRPK